MTMNARQITLNKGSWKEKEEARRPSSPANVSLDTSASSESQSTLMLLEELKLHQENQDGHNQTKMSLGRLEQAVTDIKDQMAKHEDCMGELVRLKTQSCDTRERCDTRFTVI